MKKYLKTKYILIAAGVALIIGAGAFIYVQNHGTSSAPENNDSKTEQQESNNAVSTEKTDIQQEPPAKNPDEGKPTPTVTSNLETLNGVFLTAYYYKDPSFSMDGKTTIPAGSIQPNLFPQGSGVYSVQKKVGTAWTDVASNVSYPGHGGITAAYAGPTEDNIEYRVIKIEGGKAVSVSQIFVVKRADLVAAGVKTYN